MHFSTAYHLLKATSQSWWNDRAMSMGAAISFYTVFSLAPMLLLVISVAGLVFGREASEGAVIEQMKGLIGEKGVRPFPLCSPAPVPSAAELSQPWLGPTV